MVKSNRFRRSYPYPDRRAYKYRLGTILGLFWEEPPPILSQLDVNIYLCKPFSILRTTDRKTTGPRTIFVIFYVTSNTLTKRDLQRFDRTGLLIVPL